VLANYVNAARYCARYRGGFGGHTVRNSPLYGAARAPAPAERGPLGSGMLTQLVRLFGENPFLLTLPIVPSAATPWNEALRFWAFAVAGLALSATLVPYLRVLGPGRSFLKLGVFPAAYTLASAIGSPAGFLRPVGLAALVGAAASVAAIAVFLRYVRAQAFQTVSVPDGLVRALLALEGLPAGGVFCLPDVYSDFVAYHSGRSVLWGGHCGDLTRFAWIAPVLTRPVPEMLAETGVRYLILDQRYARAEEMGLAGRVQPLGSWDSVVLLEVVAGG
jgi:hypothetical protein